jgi:hypothetical protein
MASLRDKVIEERIANANRTKRFLRDSDYAYLRKVTVPPRLKSLKTKIQSTELSTEGLKSTSSRHKAPRFSRDNYLRKHKKDINIYNNIFKVSHTISENELNIIRTTVSEFFKEKPELYIQGEFANQHERSKAFSSGLEQILRIIAYSIITKDKGEFTSEINKIKKDIFEKQEISSEYVVQCIRRMQSNTLLTLKVLKNEPHKYQDIFNDINNFFDQANNCFE